MSDLTANESKNGLDFDLRCNCVYPKRTPQAMTDTLRTRIAAAIYNASDEYTRKLLVRPDCPGASELEGDGKPVCYVLADAVIRELGLKHSCRYCGGWGPFDE